MKNDVKWLRKIWTTLLVTLDHLERQSRGSKLIEMEAFKQRRKKSSKFLGV